MLKNITKLEVVVESKVYTFLCDIDSPLENIKEAIFQFGKFVGQVEDQIAAMAAQVKPAAAPVATPDPVVEPVAEAPLA